MKVYVFSLKSENEIYAYTAAKEYAELFRSQRNMKLFNEKVISLDKFEFMIFSNKMSVYQLCKDYLDDGEHDIEIVASVRETYQLSESCDYIRHNVSAIEKSIKDFPFKKKYLKPIIKLTQNITIKGKDEHPTLNVNTFTLFYYLFRNTFYEYDDEEILKLKEKEM